MDAMRKQLDVLMGANRNGDVREVNRKYFDRDVCRLFLAGLCPHDLFQLTKMDLGPCPKVHSLQLRKDYEEVKAKGSENFDRELEDMIDRLIVECERKIQRALKRLADEDAKAAIAISVSEVTLDEQVLQLSKEIKEKMQEVDTFDFEGKTDDKIKAMEVVEELRSKRADMQATLLLDAFNKDRASIPQTAPTQIAPLPPPPPPDARTQELINEKLSKAEALGEQGMVDEAQKVLEEAEALKKLAASRQEPASDPSKYTVADVRIEDRNKRRTEKSEDDRRSREHSKDRNGRASRDRDAERKDRVEPREGRRDHDRDRDRRHDSGCRHDRDRDRDYDRSRGPDSRRRERSRSRERGRRPDRY